MKNNLNERPLILINRYNPQSEIILKAESKNIINKQINYVKELPPFNLDRIKKTKERCKTSKGINKRKGINHENQFDDYELFKCKPSMLKSSKMKFTFPFMETNSFPKNKNKLFKGYKTYFPIHYIQKLIPCYIYNRVDSPELKWDKNFEDIDYSKVLIACFEGILETTYPYKFIARQACKDLLSYEKAHDKIINILDKLFLLIKTALNDKDDDIFVDTCEIAQLLIKAAGMDSNIHVKIIIEPLNRRIFISKFKDTIYSLLNTIVKVCGKSFEDIIKKKIPSYCPNTIKFSSFKYFN